MEKEQLNMAYAAGALDGDGSFYICRREDKSYVKYVPGAGVGKSCKELIDFFMESFSGNVSQRGDHYVWSISCATRMIPFLERVLPRLKTKKEQAKCLLQWMKDGMPSLSQILRSLLQELIRSNAWKSFLITRRMCFHSQRAQISSVP